MPSAHAFLFRFSSYLRHPRQSAANSLQAIRIVTLSRILNRRSKTLGEQIMNRRFFFSSSMAVGAFAVLSRLPAFSKIAHGAYDGLKSDGEGTSPHPNPLPAGQETKSKGIKKVIKTDAEWKSQLTPEQYKVLRQKGTEYAFSSPLTDIHDKGIFECAGCGLPLFSSAQKFDSGTGWPSFWAPIKIE